MRLILSRKGFDSSSGGCPSPLFEDGSFLSLPIPDPRSAISYRMIASPACKVGALVRDLSSGRIRAGHGAHLDPDLEAGALQREAEWRPLLGQSGAAQGHLRTQGVDLGDLFLFFGLYRAVEKVGRKWRFQKNSKPLHMLWGWLQVDDIIAVDRLQGRLPWLAYHPHLQRGPDPNNTLYLASPELRLGGRDTGLPGAGVFPGLRPQRILTDADATSPSRWRLPADLHPARSGIALSFHHKAERWQTGADCCYLQSASRGQEFVFAEAEGPVFRRWLESIFVDCPATLARPALPLVD